MNIFSSISISGSQILKHNSLNNLSSKQISIYYNLHRILQSNINPNINPNINSNINSNININYSNINEIKRNFHTSATLNIKIKIRKSKLSKKTLNSNETHINPSNESIESKERKVLIHSIQSNNNPIESSIESTNDTTKESNFNSEMKSKKELKIENLLKTPMKPVKKRIIQRLFLHPKRSRFVISKNLDQQILEDDEFINEFKSLKSDGSFVQESKNPSKVLLSKKEKNKRKAEKILQELNQSNQKKLLEEEHDKFIASKKESDEALNELKARMKKLRNKKLRREFRQENAFLIQNKLVTTKELIREKIKQQEHIKKQQFKAEERQQAHRLGLAAGSLGEMRRYMKEKSKESLDEKKRNPYTERNSEGVARYQIDFAIRVQEALQAVLENENKNLYLEQVLINNVRIDPSLRYADVLWDYKYEENRKTLQRSHTNDLLQQASGFLGGKVGKRLQSKYAPKFTFYYVEDFNQDTRFHSIYDTFDHIGFKTTMEERLLEHSSTPIFNPHNSSPQVVTKSQKERRTWEKKKRQYELGYSKWIQRGRF